METFSSLFFLCLQVWNWILVEFFSFYVHKHDKSLVKHLVSNIPLQVLEVVYKSVFDRR